MRQISPAAGYFPIYLHDGFDLERFSHYVAARTDFVVQDHHSYFVYTASDEAEPASQHTADIETAVTESLSNASAQQHRNLVVGEWSCALTPKSLSQDADPEKSRKEFCTGQMEVYANTTAGWSFWCKYHFCFDRYEGLESYKPQRTTRNNAVMTLDGAS
jgi:glucan 1,3-beta-glucosidase